jgi:hypothetical protein
MASDCMALAAERNSLFVHVACASWADVWWDYQLGDPWWQPAHMNGHVAAVAWACKLAASPRAGSLDVAEFGRRETFALHAGSSNTHHAMPLEALG